MINGGKMVIRENLNMKSILKYMLKNKLVVLSAFDVAIVFWIVWYEKGIEYEQLLDIQYDVLSEMGLPLIPLCDAIYNTIIVAIVFNMIVLLLEIRRGYKGKYVEHEPITTFIYTSLIMFCMLWGSFYISTRIYGHVISESNTLFQLPIWLFGEELFTSIITVPSLYFSVCVIHLCICLLNLYFCIIHKQDRNK